MNEEKIALASSRFLKDRHALMAFIYGLTHDAASSEDILQEVWLKLFHALTEKEMTIDNQAAWCRGTAKNLILHYWRSKRDPKVVIDSELIDLVDQAFTESEPESDLVTQRQHAMQKCLEMLPEQSRQLLHYRYYQGLSFKQMAQKLGKTTSSLMMSTSRLRKSLQNCIASRLQLHQEGAQ